MGVLAPNLSPICDRTSARMETMRFRMDVRYISFGKAATSASTARRTFIGRCGVRSQNA